MNFATGYAFNTKDLFVNLNLKKLKLTRDGAIKWFKTNKRREVAVRVFLYTLKLILLDIVTNNVTFKLPVKRDCKIQMKRTSGEDFKKARRNGKFLEVDYLVSNFSGYDLELVYIASERDIHKPIHVSKSIKNIITEKTNQGFQYY